MSFTAIVMQVLGAAWPQFVDTCLSHSVYPSDRCSTSLQALVQLRSSILRLWAELNHGTKQCSAALPERPSVTTLVVKKRLQRWTLSLELAYRDSWLIQAYRMK